MRIHIQNPPDPSRFDISPDIWQAAVARSPDIGAGHDVSFASSLDGFVAAARDAEAIISPVSEIHGRFPIDAPALRLIFCLSAGLDRLAPFDWLPEGVALLNNRGAHSAKAGEYAIMALLMLANNMPALITAQHEQRWEKMFASILRGRRLTVIGLGGLGGAAVAQAARFGLEITGVRTHATPYEGCARVVTSAQLDSVLPTTEFLLLACPLTPATHHLLDRRRLALLPAGAAVINIGRGALIEQNAICDSLDSGHLSGAVLDVFTPEPVPAGHRLWTTKNLIMTPHCSADDPATYNPISLDIFFANLRAFRDGQTLPNRVLPDRGY
jgi:phosphoglycerate dehydrogenase-like enzyme